MPKTKRFAALTRGDVIVWGGSPGALVIDTESVGLLTTRVLIAWLSTAETANYGQRFECWLDWTSGAVVNLVGA